MPSLADIRLFFVLDHIKYSDLDDHLLVAQHSCTTSSIRRISVTLSSDSDAGLLRVLASLQRVSAWSLTALYLNIPGEALAGARELIEVASQSLVRLDFIISDGRE